MGMWHHAKVLARRAGAEGLTELDLDVSGTPVEATYQRPGQYVRLGLPDLEDGIFAIASAPRHSPGVIELLVKAGSPLPDALIALPPGAIVRISETEGGGFPVEAARGKDVLLFATGSGISPLRALIQWITRERAAYGRVSLYFGARTPEAFAYLEELEGWQQADIDVFRTVSRPGTSGWQGLTGYVQSHVAPGELKDAVAFLCGQEEMVAGVTDVLVRQGISADRIFVNY
jgi:NAD(P)H-flavin reductase